MTWVKYILHCILRCFRLLLGPVKGTIEETAIGVAFIGFGAIVLVISLFLLDRKTRLNHRIVVPCAIGIAVLAILIIFAIITLIEFCIKN